MRIRRILAVGFLILCGVMAAVTPLHSADDAKPAPAEPAPPVEEKPVTKIYDVRALISHSEDFGFNTSPHSDAFVIPGDRPDLSSTSGNNYGNGAFTEGNRERTTLTPAERMEQLIKLITDTVAADSWRDAGGTIGSVRSMHDMLVVTQTAQNHKEISALLQQLKEFRTRTVRITADWLLIPPADVDKLLKQTPGDKSERRALREVDPASLATLTAPFRRSHADLLCRDGQTVHFISGRERSVTVNETASVGTGVAAYSPFVGNIGDGIALAINAAVDREEKKATVTLFSTFNDEQKPGPPVMVRTAATTQASAGDHITALESSASYRELDGIVQEVRTTVRMPLGVPVMVGAMTLEPSAKNAEARQLVLIVKVQPAE